MVFKRNILRMAAVVCAALAFGRPALADEGMWLPILLQQNQEEMQRLGLQLTAEDIYIVCVDSVATVRLRQPDLSHG